MNGKPIQLTPGQNEIFETVIKLKYPRTQVIAPTQYGKSLTLALAAVISATILNDRFTILAPSEKKAQIIMNFAIEHLFDSKVFLEQLELDPTVTLDRLRRERSRSNLSFRGGGGLMILTLDARNSKSSIHAAMGFGSNRIILDESSLIDDTLYSTVKRMLGGYAYKDTFLLEIGNPFYRNHFYRTWGDPAYNHIFIDYKQALAEGRYSPEFIDEMRKEAFFDIYYECKFPDEESIDRAGFRFMYPTILVDGAMIENVTQFDTATAQTLRLGADIGAGGDYNAYYVRNSKEAWLEGKNQSRDTMVNVTEIMNIMDKYGIKGNDVFIDDIGIGRGVSDRLKEKGIAVNGVAVGGLPVDKSKYLNIKAENYWNLKMWLDAGGKVVKNPDVQQLTWIKYKVNTDKVLQVEPKDQLIMRTGKSPDCAEALMLTFSTPPPVPSIRFV